MRHTEQTDKAVRESAPAAISGLQPCKVSDKHLRAQRIICWHMFCWSSLDPGPTSGSSDLSFASSVKIIIIIIIIIIVKH